MTRTASQYRTAKDLGVTKQAVNKRVAKGTIPTAGGKVDLDEFESQQRIEHAEKVRKMTADADMAEMKAATMRGELVPVAEVEREWFTLARGTRNAVLAVPPRVIARIRAAATEHEARAILDGELRVALTPQAGATESAQEVEHGLADV